ncbi:hypothetical protein [Rhizobacter fulvus]
MTPIWRDVALALLTALLLFASVPLAYVSLGLSWAALNHHFYLGWSALHPRFHLDVDAAHSQVYQYPYLYVPLYLLAAAGATGVQAGVALAALQALVAVPLALLARKLLPGESARDIALRWFGVLLGLLSPVVLSQMDSTSNDLLASIPLVFAVALLVGDERKPEGWWRTAALAGALGGASVGFKLSNAPMLLATIPLWLVASPPGLMNWLRTALLASTSAIVGYVIAYAPWGFQLWKSFGNPFYPMFDGWFHNVASPPGGGGSALMSRFIPETLAEALARPLVMADPSSGVYLEIPAPDSRFAIALLLALWLGALVWNQRARCGRALTGLAGFIISGFALWEATSGNGRYFVPALLVVGPLIAALMVRLALSTRTTVCIAIGVLALQGLSMQSAWAPDEWALTRWKRDYFDLRLPNDLAHEPATFLTASGISFSLIAPKFHPQSSWISISDARQIEGGLANERISRLISRNEAVWVIGPRLDSQFNGNGEPQQRTAEAIDAMMAPYGLRLKDPLNCRFLESTSLPKIPDDAKALHPKLLQGFTICRLTKSPASSKSERTEASELRVRAEAVLQKLEMACPKFFPRSGNSLAVRGREDYRRGYAMTDIGAIVRDDGLVYYKYFRALNPVVVGNVATILRPDFAMPCDRLQGRYHFPWDKDF